VIRGMTDLGGAGGRGEFATAVLEFAVGMAVVAVLHSDALLVILVRPDTNVGTLLFDIRRHRTAIAGLL
jgi:predicted regulator of Ras-like GTPase activity (Roadblock/LC7/MglB family)